MSRIFSLLMAVVLALACLPAASEGDASLATLGGTSWRSPDGVIFHFTGNARLFFSFDPEQPMYHFIGDGLYLTAPAAEVGGPYIVLDSARVCEFTVDGRTLLVYDKYDASAPAAFTYVNTPAALAGTRWLDEHGTIFEFSADSAAFTCGCYGSTFRRTLHSLGAYYEMSISTCSTLYFSPDEPIAMLPDGDTLRVYGTKDGTPYLWQAFTRITE